MIDDVKAKVETLLREAGAHLIEAANQEIGVGAWLRAVVDLRHGPEHATSISKDAVFLPDGACKSLRESADATFAISDAHDLVRTDESLLGIRWFGIILTAYPDGSCKWEYLTDSNCVDSFEMEW